MEIFEQKYAFLEDNFTNGKNSPQRHLKMRDACDSMTCERVEGTEFYPYKCCLGRCEECPTYPFRCGESSRTGDGAGSRISWTQYETQYHCRLHQYIGASSVCQQCKLLPKEEQPKKNPIGKLQEKRHNEPIGVFMEDYYVPFVKEKYRQHKFLLAALGNRHCGLHRHASTLCEADPWCVACERDYTDRMNPDYNYSPMS